MAAVSSSSAAASMTRKEWDIPREHELRCEVPDSMTLTLKLVTGNAEIFGIEMAPSREYTFRGQNLAVFTWYGCHLESVSSPGVELYQADTTPMIAYVNTHIQLEARRDVALAAEDHGPKVRPFVSFALLMPLNFTFVHFYIRC